MMLRTLDDKENIIKFTTLKISRKYKKFKVS